MWHFFQTPSRLESSVATQGRDMSESYEDPSISDNPPPPFEFQPRPPGYDNEEWWWKQQCRPGYKQHVKHQMGKYLQKRAVQTEIEAREINERNKQKQVEQQKKNTQKVPCKSVNVGCCSGGLRAAHL